MADAEQERGRMAAILEQLELDKRELEVTNAKTVEENRALLDQLENLNNAVAESDSQVKTLTATLHSTRAELERVVVLAARTEQLERQLIQLEMDQADLHESLETSELEGRSAVQRWRDSERTIIDLQFQVDKIEQEAQDERERHVEIVGRMERRIAVENELGTAAGRLKSAAAARGTYPDKGGTNVVSHFVKDILQDNANLQLGIVELRDMLHSSNEEVEKLREQLLLHQPLEQESTAGRRTPALQHELSPETLQKVSQEVHVHHHYHAPATPEPAGRSRTPVQRRVKKKRNVISSGIFTPPSKMSGSATPLTAIRHGESSSASTILSQTSVTIPQHVSAHKRWANLSNGTTASILSPASPRSPYMSSNRTSSVFERVYSDAGMDSTRPTSPESNDPGSPLFVPVGVRTLPELTSRSYSTPSAFQLKAPPPTAILIPTSASIPEHPVDEMQPASNESSTPPSSAHPTSQEGSDSENSNFPPTPSHIPVIRRATSHESLLSVSGMDIHTLRHRPSQLLTPSSSYYSLTTPILSATNAVAARPSLLATNAPSKTRSLLSEIAAERRAAAPTPKPPALRETLGKAVGGWVLGRWGVAPAPSAISASSPSSSSHESRSTPSVTNVLSSDAVVPKTQTLDVPKATKPMLVPAKKLPLRPAGVNQEGGLSWVLAMDRERERTNWMGMIAKRVDEDALRESLVDG